MTSVRDKSSNKVSSSVLQRGATSDGSRPLSLPRSTVVTFAIADARAAILGGVKLA